MSGHIALGVAADPASCSDVGGRLVAAAARLSTLDAHPDLRRDFDALGRALQRHAVRMSELTRTADEVSAAIGVDGLRLNGLRVELRPNTDATRPDTSSDEVASADVVLAHTHAVRGVAQHAARARRRLRLTARGIS